MDQWKMFEQSSAGIFGEKRCPANIGGRYDFPRDADMYAVFGQCKNVKTMSMNALTTLATEMSELANSVGPTTKLGVVCVKIRQGRGKGTEPIIAMTFAQFLKLIEQPNILDAIRKRRAGMPVETVRMPDAL